MRSTHQQKVDKFMRLANQEVPVKPEIPSKEIRELRANLILEECLETIKALGFIVSINENDGIKIIPRFEANMIEVADGCADIKVVTTGTLSAFGIDDSELQDVVDENNLAKFGPGGYRREDGKWMKPPDHQPPDIAKILSQHGDTS